MIPKPTPRLTIVLAGAAVAVTLTGALPAATTVQQPLLPWEIASARVPEAVRDSKPWQRFIWAWQERAAPDGYVPQGALTRAFEQIRSFENDNPQLRSAAQWTSVGPSPFQERAGNIFVAATSIAGRVAAVAVNPKKKKEVIIGAALGGIHMSSNGGKTWKSAGDDLKTLAIGSIAYAPSDPKTIYVGTGDSSFSGWSGVGIYKSTNGGKTWKLINQTPLEGLEIGEIIVDPKDKDHLLFASISFGFKQTPFAFPKVGIYRSTDGGVTWSHQLAGHATNLVADSKDFNTQYAAIGSIFGSAQKNGLYRSTDAGVTWTKLSGPWDSSRVGRIELALAPSDPDVLYVGIQDSNTFKLLGLFKTANASGRDGARAPGFEEVTVPSMGNGWGEDTYCGQQCWYDHVLLVDPNKPDTLWAGGIFLWRLENDKWELILPGHVDVHALAFAGKKQLFVGNDGGIFSTKNSGKTWTSHNDDLTLMQFYHGSIDGLDFMLGGAQDNGTSVRDSGTARRGGDPWTSVGGGDGADNEISASDPANDWVVSSQFLHMSRTTDGGDSFQDARGAINTEDAPFIAVFAKCPSNDDIFYAGTDRIWKATDVFSAGGAPNWEDQGPTLPNSDTVRAIAVSPADPSCNTVAMATKKGGIFYSKNGGKKWNNADKRNKVPPRVITDLAFHPQDKNTLTLTLGGFSFGSNVKLVGHVFRTTSANKNNPKWTNISPPLNLPFQTVEYQPGGADKLWLGTDLGVWEQVGAGRGGIKWTHHGPETGLPNVAVFDLRATADGVVAFTHGRGAWVLRQAAARQK